MIATLITNKSNLKFLTQKNYSNMFVILTQDQKHLFTDPRYRHATEECLNFKVWIYSNLQETIQEFLKKNPITEIHFEDHDLSLSKLKAFKKIFKPIPFKALKKNPILEQRKFKTETEIKNIQAAQNLNEKIYKKAISKIQPGVSEIQIANFIKIQAIKNNSEISFEPIVGFAENSANIHHTPTTKTFHKNDCVLIDMGLKVNGYCSDMTRILPNSNQDYLKHLEFLKTLIKNIENNFHQFKTLEDIDQYSKEQYQAIQENLPHSLGHGIGIDVHEKPFFGDKTPLQDGLVFTIEPGIYIPGKYGIRLENIYYIQDSKLINCNNLKF